MLVVVVLLFAAHCKIVADFVGVSTQIARKPALTHSLTHTLAFHTFFCTSHAWGREKGFHTVLANSVCDRRGEVERKRRSDAGKVLTVEERTALREERIKRSKASLESGTTSAAAVTATASSSVVPASTAISTASTTTAMDSKSTTKILASIAGAAAQVITIQTPLQL